MDENLGIPEMARSINCKHIFIDIVNYTHKRSVEAQTELIFLLNSFVRKSLIDNNVNDEKRILIPTGDGMCISLISSQLAYDIHIKISLCILELIELHNSSQHDIMRKFQIRIGINQNIDNLIIDINGNKNISGSGINNASRIENLCDANQILVGESVYEILAQREEYMNSFTSYTVKVKHDLLLKVHHYTNKKLTYLNNEIPEVFRSPLKIFRLTVTQAYYLINCIKNEEFISEHVNRYLNEGQIQILMLALSHDCMSKDTVTKLNSKPVMYIKKSLKEHLAILSSIDFWLIRDFNSCIIEKHLGPMRQFFTEGYLFVNEVGKRKLLEDYPNLYEQYKIK